MFKKHQRLRLLTAAAGAGMAAMLSIGGAAVSALPAVATPDSRSDAPAWEISGFGDVDNQTARAGEAFAKNLRNEVREMGGRLVPDAVVQYEITGKTGSYFGEPGRSVVKVPTNASGLATAPAMTAGTTSGAFAIKVTTPESPGSNPAYYQATVAAQPSLAIPTIIAPPRNEVSPTMRLTGTGEAGARIRLADEKHTPLPGSPRVDVTKEGTWSLEWASGQRDEPRLTVTALQDKDGRSNTSDPLTVQVKQVLIESPEEGSVLSASSTRLTVRGRGIPGDIITVTGCTIGKPCTPYGATEVQSDGLWSITKEARGFYPGNAYVEAGSFWSFFQFQDRANFILG
ncbi:Ig-like domain-containing protein [Curtobacterium sp. MCLR17_054]|uniref:Ig-like domain-containing protein n=1 Tax=Curtobacterium sp. MCLR17_054 TaxID=2175632 RepID=UPI000DA969A1|nr:Ig-like domain-containing protein [Curtobacterium sp. MCLR17_054]WIE70337.1 Ig-like domain-containing protein [Curtobacterium sp. MCLR17_054]